MTKCLLCNQALQSTFTLSFLFSWKKLEESPLCLKCSEKFEKIPAEQACIGCGRRQNQRQYCTDCRQWQKEYPRLNLNHTALYVYNEIAREYMNQYKFQGDLLLASVFRQPIQQSLQKSLKDHLITPVPLSPSSKKNRGFNQVELLLKKAQIPYQQILKSQKQEALQSSKNRSERLKTPQPFQLIHEIPVKEAPIKKVLIVDDVYTTGRTILHARQLLEDAETNPFETVSFSLFR